MNAEAGSCLSMSGGSQKLHQVTHIYNIILKTSVNLALINSSPPHSWYVCKNVGARNATKNMPSLPSLDITIFSHSSYTYIYCHREEHASGTTIIMYLAHSTPTVILLFDAFLYSKLYIIMQKRLNKQQSYITYGVFILMV